MAVTVKNDKKRKAYHFLMLLAPKHNRILHIFFSPNASNEMMKLIDRRLLAGKELSASAQHSQTGITAPDKHGRGGEGLMPLLLHRHTSEILYVWFQATVIK